LRSIRFPVQILFAAFALGAGSAAGCSTQAVSAESAGPGDPLQDTGSSGGAEPKPPSPDASAPKLAPYHGNPLCLTGPSTCMPDDDGYQRSLTNTDCVVLPPVAGTDGGPPAEQKAKGCRVYHAPLDAMKIGPQCLDAAPAGRDGASCTGGDQCAPGFDCIAGDKGATCRHYCCSGTCKGNLSNGGATFCDVQNLVSVPNKAPVCMPIKRCDTLLGNGECSQNESCTVVTEGGDTGCVPNGERQVGASCDDAHCAAKLTCLGQPGSRKCFKLCKVNASDCPNTQTCVPSAAFQDADFGICQ
jgi:hypothetical protein